MILKPVFVLSFMSKSSPYQTHFLAVKVSHPKPLHFVVQSTERADTSIYTRRRFLEPLLCPHVFHYPTQTGPTKRTTNNNQSVQLLLRKSRVPFVLRCRKPVILFTQRLYVDCHDVPERVCFEEATKQGQEMELVPSSISFMTAVYGSRLWLNIWLFINLIS